MNLEDYISEERLKIYETILKLKEEETIDAYNWNKAVSSSMHPLMHCLEVTLRNSIDYNIRHTPPQVQHQLVGRYCIEPIRTGFSTCSAI